MGVFPFDLSKVKKGTTLSELSEAIHSGTVEQYLENSDAEVKEYIFLGKVPEDENERFIEEIVKADTDYFPAEIVFGGTTLDHIINEVKRKNEEYRKAHYESEGRKDARNRFLKSMGIKKFIGDKELQEFLNPSPKYYKATVELRKQITTKKFKSITKTIAVLNCYDVKDIYTRIMNDWVLTGKITSFEIMDIEEMKYGNTYSIDSIIIMEA